MTAIESHAVPAVGQQAPDFTLPSTSGDKLTLSSLRGKTRAARLLSRSRSPAPARPSCARCATTTTNSLRRGVTILPISVDHTYSLKEYKAKYNMQVDMLSDFRRDVSRLYGVMLEDRFYSNRAYFLIDADGRDPLGARRGQPERPSRRRRNSGRDRPLCR